MQIARSYVLMAVWIIILLALILAAKGYTEFTLIKGFSNSTESRCSIVLSSDGGYFVSSGTYGYFTNDAQFWLLKLDGDGVVQWDTNWGCREGFNEYAFAIAQAGAGCMVAGYRMASCATYANNPTVIVYFSSTGTVLRILEISEGYVPYAIDYTADGYYYVTGYDWTSHASIAKVSSDNSGKIWYTSVDRPQSEFSGVVLLPGADKVGAIGRYSTGSSYDCFFYVFYASNGTGYAMYTYGGDGTDSCNGITALSDGNFVIAGSYYSNSTTEDDGWLIKINATGSIIWSKVYGGIGYDRLVKVRQTSDGTIVAAGESKSGRPNTDFWLISVSNEDGALLKQDYVGNALYDDYLRDMRIVEDKMAVMSGDMMSEYSDGYIVAMNLSCPAGTYTDTSTNTCILCSAGEYQNLAGQSTCKRCDPGYYQNATGQAACIICPVGTYQPNDHASECLSCNPGTYQNETGKLTCIGCPAGTYQGSFNATECIPCEVGHYQNEVNSTVCKDCIPGTYQNETGKETCIGCSAGTYQSAANATGYDLCDVGYFQPAVNSTTCLKCVPGTYQNETGKGTCIGCPLGTFQGDYNATGCTECGIGHFQNETNSTTCYQCVPGTYQNETGRTECKQCEQGRYQKDPAADTCEECLPGQYQDALGQTSCKNCSAGKFQGSSGQATCEPCSAGTFQNAEASTSCSDCSIGYYQNETGKTTCLPCEIGYYQNETRKATCTACDAGRYQNETGKTGCYDCDPGTYQPDPGKGRCELCPVGQYEPEGGKTTCSQCGLGKIQPETGKTGCNDCPPGSFQNETGKGTCIQCLAGEYQNQSAQTQCVKCDPGYYQSAPSQTGCEKCPEGQYSAISGAATCLTCGANWYPSVLQDRCLYKGVYTTEADYLASPVKTACFNSSGGLIKPYTLQCRQSYHPVCCQGSTKLTTTSCNFALNATDTDQYCSACTFANRATCPADGICWDDSTWTDSSLSPYPTNFSVACLETVRDYCGPRLTENVSDVECAPFVNDCMIEVVSSEYGTHWDWFRISFSKVLPSTLPDCVALFNETLTPGLANGTVSCIRSSDTSIDVVVSGLAFPLTQYAFAPHMVKSACGIYLPGNVVQNVTPPSVSLESVGFTKDVHDVCSGFTFRSVVLKPYPWEMQGKYWDVVYPDSIGVLEEALEILDAFGKNSSAEIFVAPTELYPDRILKVRARIVTPFNATVVAPWFSVTVPRIASGKKYCGPCQFDNRRVCERFNLVCWKNYKDYTVSAPENTTDCLKVIAPICYKIWNSTSLDDIQCIDFVSRYNITAMKIRPNLTSAIYSSDGTRITLNFSLPMNRQNWLACGNAFDAATLNWLPYSKGCKWIDKHTLEVEYDPKAGIMEEIVVNENSFYYDYEYAQEAVIGSKVKIEMPPLEAKLRIKGITTVTECDTVDLFAVLAAPALYPLAFKWGFAYSAPLSEPIQTEATNYFAQFAQFSQNQAVSIPSRFLKRGTTVAVTLFAQSAKGDSNTVSTTARITVVDGVPKIKFATKSQFVLELYGNKGNVVPLQVYNVKCATGNEAVLEGEIIPVDVRFEVTSGYSTDYIAAHGTEETSIETAVNAGYAKHKSLIIGAAQGFAYFKYYNITAVVKSKSINLSNSDSILIYFVKPPVKSVITTPGFMISLNSDVVLYGENSEFPGSEGDTIVYQWKCMKTMEMELGKTCECPVIGESNFTRTNLVLPKSKLVNMCMYWFSLTVSASYRGSYTRTAYNTTDFITFFGPPTPLSGKVIKGNNEGVKDVYFTFGMPGESAPADSQKGFKWKLAEVESLNPRIPEKYSEKNTFIFDFLTTEMKANIDPKIKEYDKPFSSTRRRRLEDLRPQYLTPETDRILGVNETDLVKQYRYTFAVTVTKETHPSFLFVSYNMPSAVKPRKFAVSATSGVGFQTAFTFTFTLSSSTDVDEGEYQLWRRDCPGSGTESVALTQIFSKSNTYTATLAPGVKSCDYKVEIILKVFEHDDVVEGSLILAVEEPSAPIVEAVQSQIKILENNPDLTLDQKLTILAGVSTVQLAEATDQTKGIANAVIKQLDNIDAPGGVLESMSEEDRPKLLSTATSILGNVVANQKAGFNLSMASDVLTKIDSYLTLTNTTPTTTTYGKAMIQASLPALSGLADLGKDQQFDTSFFSKVQAVTERIANRKLDEMPPGAVPHSLTSPSIDIVAAKNYVATYNESQNFTTLKGASVTLPEGLTDQLINGTNMSTGGTLVIGTSVYSTTFNPVGTIKNNTNISVESLGPASTQSFKLDLVQRIYNDLAKGKLSDAVSLKEQTMELLQVSFTPYVFQNSATDKRLNTTVSVKSFPNTTDEVVVSLPISKSANISNNLNNTLLVPVYYVTDKGVWTNANCSLDTPAENATSLKFRCKKPNPSLQGDVIHQGFHITVDIVKDVLKVIRAGNYEQLLDIGAMLSGVSRNVEAFISVGTIIVSLVIAQILLTRMDRHDLYNARIKCLTERTNPKEQLVQTSALYQILAFFNAMRKNGMGNLAKKTQGGVVPFRASTMPVARTRTEAGLISPTNRRMNNENQEKDKKKKKQKTNGYTALSKDEKEELKDVYDLYRQCLMIYNDDEVEAVMMKELEQCKILTRLTQADLDDAVMRQPATFWLLMKNEHPILNAIAKPEITTPRPVKFLVFVCALVGELFVSGYFHNVEGTTVVSDNTEELIGTTLVYTLASTLLMIPLKIIISLFLTGSSLTDKMKREDIMSVERRTSIFRTIGLVLGYGWVLACCYGIMMYIISFNDFAIDNWMVTFASSVFTEIVVLSQMKVLLKVIIGLVLMKLVRTKWMLSAAGVIAGNIIDSLSKLF